MIISRVINAVLAFVLALAFSVPAALSQEPTPVTVVNPVTVSPSPVPQAPAGVNISGVTDTTAAVSWDPVPYATQYSVWVNGQRWAGATGPGAVLEGLQPDTPYTVYVTAASESGESGPSPSVGFTTLPPVPAAPAAPSVVQVEDNAATVQWQPLPPYYKVLFYRLYVDGKAVADVEPQEGMQAARLTNLAPGWHTVAVSGINANREGPQSVPVSFEVQAVEAPAGLKVANRSHDTVWLVWDPVAGAAYYEVSVNDQVQLRTSEASCVISSLQPATAYQVSVVAVMPDGRRSLPAVLGVNTLPAPEPLSVIGLEQEVFSYVGDFTGGLIALFAVAAAFAVARAAKLPFVRRWRVL